MSILLLCIHLIQKLKIETITRKMKKKKEEESNEQEEK